LTAGAGGERLAEMNGTRLHPSASMVTIFAVVILVDCALGALGGCAASARTREGRMRSMPMSALTGEAPRPSNRWQPIVGGGASAPGKSAPGPSAEAIPDPRGLAMFDGKTGEAVGWEELVRRAVESDVVLLGEVHGHAVGLDAAATLFEDVVAARGVGSEAALSLEFLERDLQEAVDDYLSGVTDEEGFRAAAGRKESNYPRGHQRMVRAAKGAGRPVAAANAPRRYVRLARTEGFERLASLSAAQRRLFVIPGTLTEGRYREDHLKMMREMPDHSAAEKTPRSKGPRGKAPDGQGAGSASGAGSAPAEGVADADERAMGYFRSQNVWDATMAESIVRLVSEGSRPVVHVVGQFHCDYEGGLTRRVRAGLSGARVLTVSFAAEATAEGGLREADRDRAGVVVYVGEGEGTRAR